MLCGINVRFQTVFHSVGQVTHVLLTRPPLASSPKELRSFDLHVLGAPPAFVLSQDQTLWTCYIFCPPLKMKNEPNISKFVFPKLLKVSLTLLYFWNLLKWIQGFNSSCSSRMLFNFQGPISCHLSVTALSLYHPLPSLSIPFSTLFLLLYPAPVCFVKSFQLLVENSPVRGCIRPLT